MFLSHQFIADIILIQDFAIKFCFFGRILNCLVEFLATRYLKGMSVFSLLTLIFG